MSPQLDPDAPEVHDQPVVDGLASNVDAFTPPQWSREVVAELAQWKQGDLLEGAPRFWATTATKDEVIGTSPGNVDWEVIDANIGSGWVVICSQTCDIGGEGPGSRNPFIQVAPIFRLGPEFDANKLELVRRWSVKYLAPLSTPPGDGEWAADLRLIMPATKGLLLGRTRRHGFATQRDSLAFGEALGIRFRRPAVHDKLSFDIPKSLSDFIKSTNVPDPEWWQKVEQVRLLITGERLYPVEIRLVVIGETILSAVEKNVWRSCVKPCKKILRPAGIGVRPILFDTLDKLPARIYKESIPLWIPELGSPPSW